LLILFLSDAYISNLFTANLFGHLHVTRAILPLMRANGTGTILFTSSSSHRAPLPFLSHYAAAKAALSTFVASVAKEVSPLGVRVAEVVCGGFPTRLGQPRAQGESVFGQEGVGIAAYAPLMQRLGGMFAADPMRFMPGDVSKAAQTVVDLVKGEGVAEGRPWVISVALGSDSWASGKQFYEQHLKLLDDSKDLAFQTDRDDQDHVTSEEYLKFGSLIGLGL
jgi:NAD(P)-dependent dehydrogenase (short-subunit alcohol dehydrogenase family)